MKKITISIIIILVGLILKTNAQTNYTPIGTWRWVNGNDTVQFFFKTATVLVGDDDAPIIFGFHKYVKNGIVIENNLSNSGSSFNQNLYSLFIPNNAPVHNPRMDGQLKDITLNNNRRMIVKRINPTTMTVNLTYIQGVRNNRPYGFTLPRSFTLTKQ